MVFKVEKEHWRKIGVYCITNNINNKIYIGSTTTNFRHRFLQYRSGFIRKLDNQPILYRAFNKYGFENFKFEIISICSKEDTIKMEQFYINKGTDYNACLIAGSLQGLKHSNESKTRTVKGGNHHCSKEVYQFTLEGVFIKKHNSLIEALQGLGKSKNGSSHITGACTGRVYSAFGYKWSFKPTMVNRVDKRTLPISEIKRAKMSKPRKKIFIVKGVLAVCFEDQKEIFFTSVKEASRSLKILETSIHNNISNRSKLTKSKLNNKKYKFKWDKTIS